MADTQTQRLQDAVAELQERLAAAQSALVKLWKHTPKIDNGHCAVCRVGFVTWEVVGLNRNPTVSPCSNADCLSHVVRGALGDSR